MFYSRPVTDPQPPLPAQNSAMATPQSRYRCPTTLRLDTEPEGGGLTLPIDPVVTVSQKNVIVRRSVSKPKMRGTVKERWCTDDLEITIGGVLIAQDLEDLQRQISDLRRYTDSKASVHITNEILNNVFDVSKVVIESVSFPHTKGLNNQSFDIKCYSDDAYELEI